MVDIEIIDGIPCICLDNGVILDKAAYEFGGGAVEGNLLDEVFDGIENTLKFLKNKIREIIRW